MDLPTALAQVAQRRESPFVLAWVTRAASDELDVMFVDRSTATVPKVRSYTAPNINDVVIIARQSGVMYCLGALNTAPIPPPEPDPDNDDDGPPAPSQITKTFRPTWTGTWRGDRWLGTSDLYQGASTDDEINYGAAYYGAAPAGLDVASIVSGTVRLKRVSGSTAAAERPTLTLLADQARSLTSPPNGYATQPGPVLLPDQAAVVNLPTSWVTDLVNGTAGGIGIAAPNQATIPYLAVAGRSTWAAAMELTITYRPATT